LSEEMVRAGRQASKQASHSPVRVEHGSAGGLAGDGLVEDGGQVLALLERGVEGADGDYGPGCLDLGRGPYVPGEANAIAILDIIDIHGCDVGTGVGGVGVLARAVCRGRVKAALEYAGSAVAEVEVERGGWRGRGRRGSRMVVSRVMSEDCDGRRARRSATRRLDQLARQSVGEDT
jgi:hypothetical protein